MLACWPPADGAERQRVCKTMDKKTNLRGSSSWPGLRVWTPAWLPAWSGWCGRCREWHKRRRQLSTSESVIKSIHQTMHAVLLVLVLSQFTCDNTQCKTVHLNIDGSRFSRQTNHNNSRLPPEFVMNKTLCTGPHTAGEKWRRTQRC